MVIRRFAAPSIAVWAFHSRTLHRSRLAILVDSLDISSLRVLHAGATSSSRSSSYTIGIAQRDSRSPGPTSRLPVNQRQGRSYPVLSGGHGAKRKARVLAGHRTVNGLLHRYVCRLGYYCRPFPGHPMVVAAHTWTALGLTRRDAGVLSDSPRRAVAGQARRPEAILVVGVQSPPSQPPSAPLGSATRKCKAVGTAARTII